MSKFEVGACGQVCVAAELTDSPAANEWANDPNVYDPKPPQYHSLGWADLDNLAKCVYAQKQGLCSTQAERCTVEDISEVRNLATTIAKARMDNPQFNSAELEVRIGGFPREILKHAVAGSLMDAELPHVKELDVAARRVRARERDILIGFLSNQEKQEAGMLATEWINTNNAIKQEGE